MLEHHLKIYISISWGYIHEYLVDYQVPPETMEKVYELNEKYNKLVQDNEDISRNVNWKLTNFEFGEKIG